VDLTQPRVDLAGYALDGIVPARVEAPRDAEGVASLIGTAHRLREAVVLHGGGTRIGIGDAPARYDMAIDLRGLRGIVEHSAPDLVCTVRAGTTLAELAAALAPSGQRWPVDAPEPERATVGGTIASAAPAASRLRHQHVRDWVIGCEAVLGDGTRVRAGGRVVKNVTGYDLTRLYSGTYGTLAALTEVSLKLVAIDERSRTLRLRGAHADLTRIAIALRGSLPLEAIVLAAGREPALYLRAGGVAPAVERVTREAARYGAFEPVDDATWSSLAARLTREPFVARLALPPGREAGFIEGDAVAYVGAGSAFLFGDRGAELTAVRVRCEEIGGALIIERAPTDRKRAIGVWGNRRAAERAVAASLKERFDPHGVLAPGRLPA
jgi:glycolate oxidase FAD binding subunit